MIVRQDKSFETSTMHPNTNWYPTENNYIIDETTKQGRDMAQIVIDNYPFFDFENDGEFVTKVVILDRPERLPEVEGKTINLIKDEAERWVYIYEDMPLTEVELLRQQLESTQEALDFLILNGGI